MDLNWHHNFSFKPPDYITKKTLKILRDLIRTEVEDQFDHKNLNIEVAEFRNLNPTAENISVVIWNKLRKQIQEANDLEVTLYETPRNYVTFKGE